MRALQRLVREFLIVVLSACVGGIAPLVIFTIISFVPGIFIENIEGYGSLLPTLLLFLIGLPVSFFASSVAPGLMLARFKVPNAVFIATASVITILSSVWLIKGYRIGDLDFSFNTQFFTVVLYVFTYAVFWFLFRVFRKSIYIPFIFCIILISLVFYIYYDRYSKAKQLEELQKREQLLTERDQFNAAKQHIHFMVFMPKNMPEGYAIERVYISNYDYPEDPTLEIAFASPLNTEETYTQPIMHEWKSKLSFDPPRSCGGEDAGAEIRYPYGITCKLLSKTPKGIEIFTDSSQHYRWFVLGETRVSVSDYQEELPTKDLIKIVDSMEEIPLDDLKIK
jgi:hypothetical protein